MIKHLKNLLSPIMMVLVLTLPQMAQAMDEAEKILFPNSNLTPDVEGLILETAVKDECNEFGCAGNIAFVCKAWDKFANEKRYISPLYKNLTVGLQTKCFYDTFCNGELIFRPTLGSDEGMIRFKFSDFADYPWTIDLSLCGDAGKYLSISTDYRKGIIAKNKDKVEIWIVSREFIKQELKEGRALQFAAIFPNWKPNAQVGIFWTWANDGEDKLNWFDYVISSDNLTLSSKNLYENWRASEVWAGGSAAGWGRACASLHACGVLSMFGAKISCLF